MGENNDACPALDKIAASAVTGQTDAVSGVAVTLCAETDDQRGNTRPSGALCDIGSVEVEQNAPTITGPLSGTFVVGQQGELDGYHVTGNPTPTLSSPDLPEGLSIQSTGPGMARIEGTPEAGTTGVHTVTITALNEDGSASMDVELTINQAPSIAGPDTIHLIETLPGSGSYFTTGVPTATLTLAAIPDSLPAGVTFTPGLDGTGTIGGTPLAGTTDTYIVTLTADNDVEPNATKLVTIEVVPVLTITTTALPNASHGHAYNATVAELSITVGKGATSLDMGAVVLDARNVLGHQDPADLPHVAPDRGRHRHADPRPGDRLQGREPDRVHGRDQQRRRGRLHVDVSRAACWR